jgi:hypothetical protein
MRPCMLRCCGWHTKVLLKLVDSAGWNGRGQEKNKEGGGMLYGVGPDATCMLRCCGWHTHLLLRLVDSVAGGGDGQSRGGPVVCREPVRDM